MIILFSKSTTGSFGILGTSGTSSQIVCFFNFQHKHHNRFGRNDVPGVDFENMITIWAKVPEVPKVAKDPVVDFENKIINLWKSS